MGDPVRLDALENKCRLLRKTTASMILNAGVVASVTWLDGTAGSWRLFKWHTTEVFLRDRKKTAPSDAELLHVFKMLLEDGYVLPTSYSRRGFPLEVSRSESF